MKDSHSDYTDYLNDLWHSHLYSMRNNNSSVDWNLDGEDNSIELATQEVIETSMPELLDYVKPTVIIGV